MPTPNDILSSLTALPHRASTSDNERRAAEIIADWLRHFGLDPTLKSFRSVRTYSWELMGIAGLFAIGVALGPFYPFIGTILAVLGIWSFWRHFDGHKTLFSPLIRKHNSQNVLAAIPPKEEKRQAVVLMAHYDTTRAGLLWAPSMVKNFRASFLMNATLGLVTVPWTWLGSLRGSHLWYQIISAVLLVYFLGQIGIFIQRETVHSPVNGANDNGSGVTAILKLAEQFAQNPLSNTEIIIAATGCEEASLDGARALINEHLADFDPATTYFLNFDNIGAGTLNYCTGEGMLSFWGYNPKLLNTAQKLTNTTQFSGVETCRYTLAYFDTLPIVKEGYKCITFIGLWEDKSIPNWHWYTDTIENIDWSTIDKSIAWGKAFIHKLDESGEQK
ncbi:MAG: putative lipoprotein aminopeptidase LpqL [Candidatus Marinimicrobia bacterium]|nr:putative lipoprotein aminopeptidase LpqL [Candidatus Neomarinimicrobiota bacterium]